MEHPIYKRIYVYWIHTSIRSLIVYRRRSEILLFYSMSCTNKLKLVRCNDEVRLGVGTSKGRSMIGRVPLRKGHRMTVEKIPCYFFLPFFLSYFFFFLQLNNILFFKITMSRLNINYSFPSMTKLCEGNFL